MGKPENITNETFRKAEDAMDMSMEESRKNALYLLEKVLAAGDESTDKNWKLE